MKIENQQWEDLREEEDDDEEEEEDEDEEEDDEENVTNCYKKARLENEPWSDDSDNEEEEEEEEEQEEENDEADFIKIKNNPDGLTAIFHEEVDRRRQKKPPDMQEIRTIIYKQRFIIQNEKKTFWRSIKEIDFENMYFQHMNLPEIELLLAHCGKYLKKLRIKSLTDSKILPIIRKYCSRLVRLDIEVIFDSITDFYDFCSNMQHLKYLKFFTNYYIGEEKRDVYTIIINSIPNKNKLVHLDLAHCYLKKNINFEYFTNLEYLDMSYIKIVNDSTLTSISQFCKQIRNLNIEGCGEVTDKGISNLGWILSLEKLNIGLNKNITDQPLMRFFNSFIEFYCGGCENIGDDGAMAIIKNAKALKKLEVYGTLITVDTLICANDFAAGLQDGSQLIVIADGSLRDKFRQKLKNNSRKNCLAAALRIRYTVESPWSVVTLKEHMFYKASMTLRMKKEGEEDDDDNEDEIIDIMDC